MFYSFCRQNKSLASVDEASRGDHGRWEHAAGVWTGARSSLCHRLVTDSADLTEPDPLSHRLSRRYPPHMTAGERPVNRRVVGSSPTRGASFWARYAFSAPAQTASVAGSPSLSTMR